MYFGKWEVQLRSNPGTLSVDLWMLQRDGNTITIITHEGVGKTYKDGEIPNPEDYFARLYPEQVTALADGLANYGAKSQNDHKNEGLLEATRAHLEDMRKLVLKDKA